jgi:AcrR family transcriptional regulator
MPKIFTEAEKEKHRSILFDNGFRLIDEHGYKNVTVDKLVSLIGASKGYFYLLFDSKEEYFLNAIAWQMEREYDQLKDALENGAELNEIRLLYKQIFLKSRFANYIDMIEIRKKVPDERWEDFRAFEESFSKKTIDLLGKKITDCDPKILSNLSAMIFLSYGMSNYAPYLFEEKKEETLDILLNVMHRYVTEGKIF